jgi:hypothetical protein
MDERPIVTESVSKKNNMSVEDAFRLLEYQELKEAFATDCEGRIVWAAPALNQYLNTPDEPGIIT